ncbi:MAG: TonB-dependent receptor, partial [Deltaproteobacteria bacterium]|nr:TonB-dependent receptor [Deltaproteobacteria bacterium]
MMNFARFFLALGVVGLLLGNPGGVWAETSTDDAAIDDAATEEATTEEAATEEVTSEEDALDDAYRLIEEVVVTARRRKENLQDTPISISAYTAESLEYRGVTRINQIAEFTPNLVFQNNPSFGGASNTAAIYIRGVGQKEFLPTVEPGVGLYVDGVYIARSVGAILDLIDVERVEVLRGPQGTLFGRNTIGGAISITTKKPDEELGGKVEFTGGSSDRRDWKGTLNIPITDQLFSKFSLASFERDGYLERASDGIDLGNDDSFVGRMAFRFVPSDDLEFNLVVERTEDEENGPPLSLTGIEFSGNPGNNFAIFHNFVTAGCFTPPNGDPGNSACYNEQWMIGDKHDAGTAPAFSDVDVWGTSLTVDWSVGGVDVKSITAYRDLDSEFARDGDHSPHTVVHFYDDLEQDQFTQEIQLQGLSFEERLTWILGLYYFDESGDNVNLLDFAPVAFRSGGKFDNESLAAFAQGTFDITEQLSLTLGLRYTDETKEFKPDQIIFVNRTPDPSLNPGTRILPFRRDDISIDETSPLVNLAYHWNEDLMTYASYSEGFKSGGFVQRVFPPITDGTIPSFKPEFVETYELGFKWTGFDNRLRLNGAAFYMDYSDLQIQVFNNVAPVTKNVADAEIKGFELEISAVPGDGWFLEAGAGYLDSEYNKIDPTTTNVFKDNKFERISDWTLNAAVSKELECGKVGRFTPR